ncbi:hypothetical protein PFICI_10201 [Pestalotiopsis fici W106-1]|uniref:Uncharacterized protein n=1 Tax=Pestalotiopsis fici (strain W106-1 / CGMCC3.15140) TaxID=1229662 RepID=W3WWF8_PESFW|nr:uncharacterized protein PFICI_10201 [Pestalotiopsis fici W106-1]ETS78139.1 hypothetical protein PFICI_10201 [Pestalotiopsis fici W106-1]
MNTVDQAAEQYQRELGEEPAGVPENDFWGPTEDSCHDIIPFGEGHDIFIHTMEPPALQRQIVASDARGAHGQIPNSTASFLTDQREDLIPNPYESPRFNWPHHTTEDVAMWKGFVPDSSSAQLNAPDGSGHCASATERVLDAFERNHAGLRHNHDNTVSATTDFPSAPEPMLDIEALPNDFFNIPGLMPGSDELSDLSHDSSLGAMVNKRDHTFPKSQWRSLKRDKCKGTEGSKCSMCIKHLENLRMYSLRSNSPSINHIDIGPIKLGTVAFYEINDMHYLLVKIREEIDSLYSPSQNETLEASFKGDLICHISDGGVNPHSITDPAVPIPILELSTTSAARRKTRGQSVAPALNARQLDRFIDTKAPPGIFSKLETSDVGFTIPTQPSSPARADVLQTKILNCALRSAYYFGILFNWTSNIILYDPREMNKVARGSCGNGLQLAKNLVLETLYSIVHRIDCLVHQLFEWVGDSFKQHRNSPSDPATISCALWILYSSVNKFQKLDWNSIHVNELRKFLDGLRDRSKAALVSVQRYNWMVSYKCCGQRSDYLTEFVDLVEKAKTPSFVVSFAYEYQYENPFFLSLHGVGTGQLARLSYVDVLKKRGEEEDPIDEFYRLSSRSPAYKPGSKQDGARYPRFTQEQGRFDQASHEGTHSSLTRRDHRFRCEDKSKARSVTREDIDKFANLSTTHTKANDLAILSDDWESNCTRKRQASSSVQSITSTGSGEEGLKSKDVIVASRQKRIRMSRETPRPTPFLGSYKRLGDMLQSVFGKITGN